MGEKPTPEELAIAVRRMKASIPASIIRATIFASILSATIYFDRHQKDVGVDWWVIIGLIVILWVILFAAGVFFAGAPRRER